MMRDPDTGITVHVLGTDREGSTFHVATYRRDHAGHGYPMMIIGQTGTYITRTGAARLLCLERIARKTRNLRPE